MHIHVFGFFLPNIYQIKSCESPCLLGITKMANKQFTKCKHLITKYLQYETTILTFALSKKLFNKIMSKRKDLIKSYDNFKTKSFYGVGQRKAKLFMNSMLKKLDAQIKNSPEDSHLSYRRGQTKERANV